MNVFNSKKTYMAALLLFGFAVSSLAFSNDKREPDFNRLADKLELVDYQKAEFISVMKIQHEKRQALKEVAREDRKSVMEQHHSETLSSLSEVLNDEQLGSFEAHVDKRKERHEARKMSHKDND